MRKLSEVVSPQLDVAAELAELKTRTAALETRVEKEHPSPSLATREPFAVGSNVYSLQDLGARYPYLVIGYEHGKILLEIVPGEPARAFPIESVVPLSKCRNAEPTAGQLDEHLARMDPKSREFYIGRKKAQLEAVTGPPKTFIEKLEERYAGGR